MMKEERVSREVIIRRRKDDVVVHAPKWTCTAKKAATGPMSKGPKNGDAAVVIAHADIQELCNKLQEILAHDARGARGE